MQTLAILQLAMAILPLVNTGLYEFIIWMGMLRAAAQQTSEWTDEYEKQYRAALFAKTGDLAYGPDPT